MDKKLARLNNTTSTFITLPSVRGFPEVRLGPKSGKAVAQGYIDALRAGRKGPAGFLLTYLERGHLRLVEARDGVTEAELAKAVSAPEGPPPPANLDGITTPGAIAIVNIEEDVKALTEWGFSERRPEVKEAITARLAVLAPNGAKLVAPSLPGLTGLPGFPKL